MTDTINLYKFLSNKKILHSYTSIKYTDALKYMIINKNYADIITYNSIMPIIINNTCNTDENGYSYYEFFINKSNSNYDIIDNIILENFSYTTAKLNINIDNNIYEVDEIKDIITFLLRKDTDIKLRITFKEPPNINDEFKILMKCYLLNSDDKKILANKMIICDKIIYKDDTYYIKSDNPELFIYI